jgi:hypothetical protein
MILKKKVSSIRVRVTRTDDGETLLERHLSTSEYLALLKSTYAAGESGRSSQADGESGDAYDLLIQADL